MQFLRDTNIDFMKHRKAWIAFSFAVMVVGLVSIFFLDRLNLGLDFVGGTQLTIKFKSTPDVEQLRETLAGAGFREAQIQRFGAEGEHEIIVRTQLVEGQEEASAQALLAALGEKFGGATGEDLNQIGAPSIAALLAKLNPDGVPEETAAGYYGAVASGIDWSQVQRAAGLTQKAFSALQGAASFGEFSVLANESVGPQVGAELRQRSFLAVVFSLLGVLVYLWIRFELRWAVGATMATLHDVLITLGNFALVGYEFNLTTIAAFLTLVGYSVNDKIVSFDRVRENLRKSHSGDVVALLNRSLNQMLSRTLLTGGTTIMATAMLWLFGGDAIRGFSFIILVGVIVGTYSSIYIASPFALLWEQWFGGRGKREDAKPKSKAKPAAPAARTSASR
jgi:preprotein translocase subunit SecF